MKTILKEDRVIVVTGQQQYVFRADGLRFILTSRGIRTLKNLNRVPTSVLNVARAHGYLEQS